MWCPVPGGGAGAQATHGAPGAALNWEAGTTPLTRGVPGAALSRVPLYCPLFHDFDDLDHLNLGIKRAIICMWYSLVSAPVTVYAPSQCCNCGGMSVRRILPSTYSPVSPSVVLPL
jgi:hypothetical protein